MCGKIRQMKVPMLLKILSVIFIILFILLLIRGPEDTWICQDGNWVRHGNPSAAMPTKPCK